MAKASYTKKRTGTKTGGRYTKKKTVGRVAKRSGTTSTAKLDALIARQVQKVLSSGALKERRKITLELSLPQTQVFINGKQSVCNSVRIPITSALPPQQGTAFAPDVRRRKENKLRVTGVNVRASFSVSDETRVMLVPYEPHESVRRHLEETTMVTEPNAELGGVPEGFVTQMVPFQHLGLVSEHGPLMTKKSSGHVLGGQERFNCRDFQQETRTVDWGLPCIWTCNFDNDPRKDRGVADYIGRVAYVVEIRDRPGERGWGKLYEAENDVGQEEDSEWMEALAEVESYMDTGYDVDEAVDVSENFGI